MPGTPALALSAERRDRPGRAYHPVKRPGQRMRRYDHDGTREKAPERRTPRGIPDLRLMDIPLHVLTTHIELDRRRLRACRPLHRPARGVQIQRGDMLLEPPACQVEQLDEQRRADPLRRVHPLLVERVEP